VRSPTPSSTSGRRVPVAKKKKGKKGKKKK
jgi:hypothetical protein